MSRRPKSNKAIKLVTKTMTENNELLQRFQMKFVHHVAYGPNAANIYPPQKQNLVYYNTGISTNA